MKHEHLSKGRGERLSDARSRPDTSQSATKMMRGERLSSLSQERGAFSLDEVVSQLKASPSLSLFDPGRIDRGVGQILPGRKPSRSSNALGRVRRQIVHLKMTRTGGSLEIDLPVRAVDEATLRIDVDRGQARAVCTCTSARGGADVQRLVEEIREIMTRSGLELTSIDIAYDDTPREGGRKRELSTKRKRALLKR